MQFHVTIKVHDAIVLEGDKLVRQSIGAGLERLMGSGKIHESGLLGGVRGGFFLIDIDAPENLYELFGPEIYGTCAVEAPPRDPGREGWRDLPEMGRGRQIARPNHPTAMWQPDLIPSPEGAAA